VARVLKKEKKKKKKEAVLATLLSAFHDHLTIQPSVNEQK